MQQGQARVSASFRPLSSESQVRSLGDLDLGHPRLPVQQVQSMVAPSGAAAGLAMQQGQVSMDTQQPNYSVLYPGYSISSNATLSYLPQQPMPMQQVQYVYRSVPAQ